MPITLRRSESTLEALEDLAASGLSAQQLLEEAGREINRVVPSDGYFMSATDPETSLCMGGGVVHDLPHELCQPTWDYEFLVPDDYLKFVDVARSGRRVADLHDETGGRPERSARWREFAPATGFRAEVRSVFTAGGAIWGVAQFDRLGDAPRYSDEEKAWLDRVATVLAAGLRQALVTQPAQAPASRGPGIVLIDGRGGVVSATREASAWLDEVDGLPYTNDAIVPLPIEASSYAARVRSASDEAAALARTRLRTRTGVWLTMHASMLQGTDHLALVIEPSKGSDVAPLIVEAYGLTQRELEVTRAIARGLGTAEIAGRLYLSPHTVRDHVKAIFEKVGVSSRGELVARVFADHYAPPPDVDPERG